MNKNLSLRTGKHTKDGQGKDLLNLSWCKKIGSKESFIKITICFPVNSSSVKDGFWLWADTIFYKETAKKIVDYLEKWNYFDARFKTGNSLKERIRFLDRLFVSEKAQGKKITIFNPGTDRIKQKAGSTIINLTQSKAVVEFLKGFLTEK